ncbi:hypothetical protein LHA31_12310 (plasmid) [Carnobacterium viridans]|uniref:YolD-like protein n=1 Tax=Carnobacterium viridans TaxID=174587 RepID=A0A1H0XIC1_9LACT|nr:hypothetical protein [Carnobacterium viridans]UDE96432.1 hypothetical protein LHA31_12310 [Carnobacterium viridans]SDQ02581.1 hypothetical protein SAMN04487752_0093 [Carnobacterium viridans]
MNLDIEENIIINPNTSGYVDRKMAKWQGLILSEHTETVNDKKKNNRKVNIEKEKQSVDVIYSLIDFSYSQKVMVSIQVDCLFNGSYQDDIIGVVFGYLDNNIYIQTIDSGLVVCELELIRNIENHKQKKWFKV